MLLSIHPRNPEPRLLRRVADTLRAGGVIVYPTDTIYGIGCSIESREAIERVYMIKRMKHDKPLSFVCSDLTHLSDYAHVSNPAFRIMKHLIPGPYTFILPAARMKKAPRILISRRKTVGIRVPDHRITQALVSELAHPILSASVTDGMSEGPHNDPEQILERFGHQVDLVIDGGVLVSEPSSIIDLTGDRPKILRRGAGDLSLVE